MRVEMKPLDNGRKHVNLVIESEEEPVKMGFDHWPTGDEWAQNLRRIIENKN